MNEASSRSHCVLGVCLEGHNATTGESKNGVLNLIDLAGSERLKTSGAQVHTLKYFSRTPRR